MKQQVEVKGVVVYAYGSSGQGCNVTLSRAQVEAALKELNTSESREIGEFGTEAFHTEYGTHYLLFSEQQQRGIVRDLVAHPTRVYGVSVSSSGAASLGYMCNTRTVTDGKLDKYPVVKGKLAFVPDKG